MRKVAAFIFFSAILWVCSCYSMSTPPAEMVTMSSTQEWPMIKYEMSGPKITTSRQIVFRTTVQRDIKREIKNEKSITKKANPAKSATEY